jgi:hypothetical protein
MELYIERKREEKQHAGVEFIHNIFKADGTAYSFDSNGVQNNLLRMGIVLLHRIVSTAFCDEVKLSKSGSHARTEFHP